MLCPNPSYPIHAFGFLMAGGVIRSVPSEPTPQFEAVERAIIHSIPKPIALIVCYPQSDRLCRRPRFLQGSGGVREEARDLHPVGSGYAEVYFDDNNPPPSVPGSRRDRRHRRVHLDVEDVLDGGWRMGFAVGNERIIAALAR